MIITVMILLMGCSTSPSTEQTVSAGAHSKVTQDAVQTTGGSSARAESIDQVTTVNEQGIDVPMLLAILAGVCAFSLVIGLIIPQPRFVRWLF